MADCVVVTRLLAARLRDAGFQARARRGYLLGLVGSDHSWCEDFEDGRWKSLDLRLRVPGRRCGAPPDRGVAGVRRGVPADGSTGCCPALREEARR